MEPSPKSSPERTPVIGAIDIGGTKIAAGLVDASGLILEQAVAPTERDKDFYHGLACIRDLIHSCLDRRPDLEIMGLGVGCTGPVDPHTGVLGPNSFLTPWEGLNTVDLFQATFGVPVAIENDADAAALGEVAWGAGQGASHCIYVTVSTGIGCGLVVDGRLYRGAGGVHPELGHFIIDSGRGPACYCGGVGCWESLASGPALAAWYTAQQLERGFEQEDGVQDLASSADLDAREICRRAAAGEALAQEAVVREGYYLGTGLANLITIFVPDVIVLGGGVMESWPLFEGQARAVIRQICGLVPFEKTQLRRASLGERTGLAGAARVWFHRYGEPGR